MGTSVKLSDLEIQLLKEVRTHLVRDGLKQVDNLRVRCLKCHAPLEGTPVGADVWECKRCGHSERGIRIGADGTVALGAVAGVSALALLSWIYDQPGREARREDLAPVLRPVNDQPEFPSSVRGPSIAKTHPQK